MPRQPQPALIDGALVINKPKGKTSHDVVDAVRHLAGFRQIGHLGTLDPLATGVLVLLLGRATRLVRFYAGRRKRYEAGFRFGCATETEDCDGEAEGPYTAPSLEQALPLQQLAEAKQAGTFAHCLIPLESLLTNFPRVNVLPVVETRVRHGTKFNIMIAQLQAGRAERPPGATTQLDGGEPKPPRLRVFSQQDKLIAIAEAVVPRTYQPIVVFEALP